MKLYRLTWSDAWEGSCLAWVGSKAAAKKRRWEIAGELDRNVPTSIDIERVEVPTSKEDLLEWLNTNLTRNNG